MRWGTMTTKAKATVVVVVAAAIWVGGVGSAGALVGVVVSSTSASVPSVTAAARPLLHSAAPAPSGVSTDSAVPTPSQTVTASPTPTPEIVVTMVSERTPVPFARTTVEDSTVPKGESHVTTAGVDGAKTTFYRVTTVDGVETKRQQVREELNRAPVAEVTTIGTYVAPAPAAQEPSVPQGHALITPGAFCADAENGVVAQAANGRSYTCGGHGPDANGHLHWNTM
ncbi:G5 domain-containing protein [Curtobacterium sp. B8]|uniref:G5 domain-containing protein n=1 Tax=Curtobacterium sp. B8 TaxID=95611 RepID=UPI0009FEDB36|nr:G5 domain-containing protein [Curtobacterium sp. B8]